MHRTYGRTQNCQGCRFWSEQILQGNERRTLAAMCIAPRGSPRCRDWTGPGASCSVYKPATHGSIDDPAQDPHRYEFLDARENA